MNNEQLKQRIIDYASSILIDQEILKSGRIDEIERKMFHDLAESCYNEYFGNNSNNAESMAVDGWISVEDRLPENVGNYICFTNDEQCMVCHINANGWWSIVPNAQYYGDMGEKVVINSKEVDREVILWMDIQHHCERAYAITKTTKK